MSVEVQNQRKRPGRPSNRKAQPDIEVTRSGYVSRRDLLVEKFAPECVSAQEMMHVSVGGKAVKREIGRFKNSNYVFWGDKDEPISKYTDNGYEPVLDSAGEQVFDRGDPMMKRKTRLWLEDKMESENESEEIVNEAMSGADATANGLRHDLPEPA